MITPHFKLPKTKMTVVVWSRRGQINEILIPTPTSCSMLASTMFEKYKVGPSEIRALKAIDPSNLISQRF